MSAVRTLAILIAMALAAGASADPPTRDPLDVARELAASLDYERALVIVDREIARGAATTAARLVELHLLAGTLAAGLDHADAAQVHFAKVLALAPDTHLPDGTSPKITAPFDAARAATVPLHVVFAGAGAAVTATAGPDPAHLFAGVRGDDAIDEYGNAIAHRAPVPIAPLGPLAVDAPPIYARWATWAIAAGGALVIGGTCAWRFGAAQDEWNTLEAAGGHDYSELAAVQARGRDWGLAANVGFGVAAAAVVTAIVLFARHRDVARAPRPVATGETLGLSVAF